VPTNTDLIQTAEPADQSSSRAGLGEKWFALVSFVVVTASAVLLFAR
jgi:hypothetical protein